MKNIINEETMELVAKIVTPFVLSGLFIGMCFLVDFAFRTSHPYIGAWLMLSVFLILLIFGNNK